MKLVKLVQNEALRIATRSFRITLVDSLRVIVKEQTLQYRRDELLLRYFFKIVQPTKLGIKQYHKYVSGAVLHITATKFGPCNSTY